MGRKRKSKGGPAGAGATTRRKRQPEDTGQQGAHYASVGATGTGSPSNSNVEVNVKAPKVTGSRDPKAKKDTQTRTTSSSKKSSKRKVSNTKCEKFAVSEREENNEGEGNSSGSFRAFGHPLLDEMIMEHVLQYVICQPVKEDVLKDIKNIRQVCKPWRNAATRLYRRTAPVLKFGIYDRNFDLYTFGNLKNFLETMKESEIVPFRSYEITGSINSFANQKLMEDFLRICGPDMVSVDFHFKKSGTFQGNLDLLNGSSQFDLSKLKTLAVDIEDDRSVYNSPEANAPVYFTGFVLNATATESLREFRFKLTFPFLTRINQCNLTSMKKFEEVICRRIPESVKVLDLQMFLTDQTFANLTDKGLSLDEFAANPSYITGPCEGIHCFLKNQAAHLKVLQMVMEVSMWKWKYYNDTLILDFPLFDKLETLKLADIHVIPFSFAEKFPNLICLDVVRWWDPETFSEFLECAKKTVPSVKEIRLPLYPVMVPFVKKISEYFPNITELRLDHDQNRYFSGTIMEKVFTHLRHLEYLHITIHPSEVQGVNLDSVFTGVSNEDLARICKRRKYDGVSLAGLQRRPSMLNMTRLRKLVLEKGRSKSFHRPVVLTDFSIHFTLLELGALAELDVFGFSTESMVRQIYLKRLKAKLRLKWEVRVRQI